MDRHKAIRNVYPDARRIDDGEGAFDKNGDQITLDESKISLEMERLQTEYDALQYQRDRETSYPEIKEQLDLLYHDMTAGKGDKTGEWYKAVNKVKTDNPKPE